MIKRWIEWSNSFIVSAKALEKLFLKKALNPKSKSRNLNQELTLKIKVNPNLYKGVVNFSIDRIALAA